MKLSFIRGLTASLLTNVSNLKKQAKRLHKAAPEVFGRDVPLDVCYEAIAKAHGFQRWSDVSEISIRAGLDRSLPFWHLFSRNNFHEKLLAAITTSELEVWEDQPLVILGRPHEVVPLALCTWTELLSLRKIPGILLLETNKPSLEDTPIGQSIHTLALNEIYSRFRVIDARERRIPGSVGATAMSWQNALSNLLGDEDAACFESTGGNHLLRKLIDAYGATTYWTREREDLPFEVVRKAITFMLNPNLFRHALLADMNDNASLEHDLDKYLPQIPSAILQKIKVVVDELNTREFGTGTVFWAETEHRPVIVLFNRNNPASEVIASVIHDMFYTRYVFQRAIRPTLYFSDTDTRSLPPMLGFGSETIIANGSLSRIDAEWQSVTMRRSMFAEIKDGTMVYSGRRTSIATAE